MKKNFHSRIMAAVAVTLALALWSLNARADDLPTAREVGAFESQATTPSDANNETMLRLQAGASLASGNTRSFSGNLAGRFILRRTSHQVVAEGVMNYGRAWVIPMGAPPTAMRQDVTTAENYLLRARYDLFVTNNNGLLVSAQAFRDHPSGFNARLSGQIGYVRNFMNVPQRRRFWGEVGYDLSYEDLTTQPEGSTSTSRVVHSGRTYLGFEEHTTKLLEVTAGLEALLNVLMPADFRLNGSVGLASKVANDFSLALTVTLRYLNKPIPGHEPLDTVTLLSVIFQHSFEPPPAPVPPANAAATPEHSNTP